MSILYKNQNRNTCVDYVDQQCDSLNVESCFRFCQRSAIMKTTTNSIYYALRFQITTTMMMMMMVVFCPKHIYSTLITKSKPVSPGSDLDVQANEHECSNSPSCQTHGWSRQTTKNIDGKVETTKNKNYSCQFLLVSLSVFIFFSSLLWYPLV